MKYDLNKQEKYNSSALMELNEEFYRYKVLRSDEERLDVLGHKETVELLLQKPKSFCRFGDGEIDIISGKSIPFQKYDKNLAEILLRILSIQIENLYVGINYNYFYDINKLNNLSKGFYLVNSKKYRDFLLKYCNRERKYISAGFNQLYAMYSDYDYAQYYGSIKKLFSGKEIVIFAGDGILDKLEYDVFELAKTKEYISGPKINAFDKYEELLEKARCVPPRKTLVFILGPCSKALVYNLTKEGFIAYDVGHLAKDYDAYMRGMEKTDKNIIDFCKPD